jgi:hypothetical protein
MANEVKEMETYWNELIYTVCKGDPAGMREIVKFNIFDFFAFVENFWKQNKK